MAIDLEPKGARAHVNLGGLLCDRKKDYDGAIACFNKAIALDPKCAIAHSNLGNALLGQGRHKEAIAACEKAIILDPNCASAHISFGYALAVTGLRDKAITEYQRAVQINNDDALAHNMLGVALEKNGQLDKAIEEFRVAVQIKEDYAEAHYNLGNALTAKSLLDEAIVQYRKAIQIKKDYVEAYNNLGRALHKNGQLEEAIVQFRKATQIKKDYAEAHINLGLQLVEMGQFAAALEELRRGHELGSRDPLWKHPSAHWVQTCERILARERKLPAILRGEVQPGAAAECLELAVMCQDPYKRLYAGSARLWGEAFAAEPKLAENVQTGHRYNAACAAALAGCGQGEDAAKLNEQERARLRQQAREWLQADLMAWGQVLDKVPDKARAIVAKQIQHWLADPDFAGVRDAALAKLPESERRDWHQLWAEVFALQQLTAPLELLPPPKNDDDHSPQRTQRTQSKN
jgi:tetratricopeptide (TPR) repeat protein